MMSDQALLIEEVSNEFGEASSGEVVFVVGKVRGLGRAKIAIPLAEARKLFVALMGASSAAHAKQVAIKGTEANLLAMQGMAAFKPTDYELGGVSGEGETQLLLRLKHNQTPIIDVVFAPSAAIEMAESIREYAENLETGQKSATKN